MSIQSLFESKTQLEQKLNDVNLKLNTITKNQTLLDTLELEREQLQFKQENINKLQVQYDMEEYHLSLKLKEILKQTPELIEQIPEYQVLLQLTKRLNLHQNNNSHYNKNKNSFVWMIRLIINDIHYTGQQFICHNEGHRDSLDRQSVPEIELTPEEKLAIKRLNSVFTTYISAHV